MPTGRLDRPRVDDPADWGSGKWARRCRVRPLLWWGKGVGLRALSRFWFDLRALESLLPAAIRPDWQPLTRARVLTPSLLTLPTIRRLRHLLNEWVLLTMSCRRCRPAHGEGLASWSARVC